MKIRTLIADDSFLYRRVLTDILCALAEVEVVGAVSNGKQALQKTLELRPDLLTLDVEMPEMDGLGVLRGLGAATNETAVIMVSSLTKQGGQMTMRALQMGAFDFITKPETSSTADSRALMAAELGPRINALARRLEVRRILRPSLSPSPARPAPASPLKPLQRELPPASVAPDAARAAPPRRRPELVLIGVSTGGPNALAQLLPALPGNLGVPILVVQHMPPMFTASLAEHLSGKCALRVREARDGETPEPNTVYIAPGGRQMRLQFSPLAGRQLQLTDDPPVNNCRPSVDYLFRSVAARCPGVSMAVILTGMGSDGANGVRDLREHGCFTIAQNEPSCVVYGMPKAVVDAGLADAVLPIESIAGRIVTTVRGGVPCP